MVKGLRKPKPKPNPPRDFPFEAGSGYRATDSLLARNALDVFEVLWSAARAGQLTREHLQPVFYRAVCEFVTNEEGWKRGRFWSVEAWKRAVDAGRTGNQRLVHEHVLPRSALLAHLLEVCQTKEEAIAFLKDNAFCCVVTKEENAPLPLHKGFPDDPWRRYALPGKRIAILDVEYPPGKHFLTDADRAMLRRHDLLVAWADLPAKYRIAGQSQSLY